MLVKMNVFNSHYVIFSYFHTCYVLTEDKAEQHLKYAEALSAAKSINEESKAVILDNYF